MTTTVLTSSTTTAYNIGAAASSLSILEGVTISDSSTYGFAISSVGNSNNARIYVDGAVVGYTGINLGATVGGVGANFVSVGTTGSITGMDYQALSLYGSDNQVTNYGLIRGYSNGINIFGENSIVVNEGKISAGETTAVNLNAGLVGTGLMTVRNSGSITGKRWGVDITDSALDLVNSGTIRSLSNIAVSGATKLESTIINTGEIDGPTALKLGSAADTVSNFGRLIGKVNMGKGDDVLINSGSINGDIKLQAGNDRFDSTNGTVIGNVDMGDGDDVFNGTGAVVHGTISGGAGSDFYYVDDEFTRIVEAATSIGSFDLDSVISTVSYTLKANFENLILAGSGNLNGSGNDLNNNLSGNMGDNKISGGRGDDIINGLDGDDILAGGNGDDDINGGEGNDRVIGNDGNDRLHGFYGDDRLLGRAGKDTITGDSGDDIIIGGKGKDILSGGDGADVFVYRNVNQSKNNSSADVIKDFETGLDKIDLSGVGFKFDIFQPGLIFVPSGPFTGIGHEYRLKIDGDDTEVLVDIDGDMTADMKIILKQVTDLGEGDFIL